MENTTNYPLKRLIKVLLCLIVIAIGFVAIFGISALFYYYPVESVCKVEFIKDTQDSFVQMYYKGDKLCLPDIPKREGYEFLGWSLSGSSDDIVDSSDIVVSDGMKLYATWTEKVYKLKYLNDDYSVKHNALVQVKDNSLNFSNAQGEEINLQAQKIGYDFVGFKDTDGVVYSQDFYVLDDMAVAPLWDIKKYKISFVNNGQQYNVKLNNSTYTAENYEINFGHDLEFKINLSKPYAFSNIRVTAVSENLRLELKPTNGVYKINDITANFSISVENITLNKYQVFVDDKYYGEFSYGSMLNVDKNNIVINDYYNNSSISINPLFDDVCFAGWNLYNDQVLTDGAIQDIAIGNRISIKGSYSKDIYRIKLVANGGEVSQEELVFFEGSQIILPSATRDGYEFAGWFIELVEKNTVVVESASKKFTEINDNYMILYAGWTKN